jgi:hypothetical protein
MAEEGKVRVRNARRDALVLLKKGNKDKTVTDDDDLKRSEKEIQTHTDKFTADIEKNLKAKEAVAEGRIRHPPRFHEHRRIPSRGNFFEKFGVAAPRGVAVESAGRVRRRARQDRRSSGGIMVKSQIHAGGRGKGTFTDGFKGGGRGFSARPRRRPSRTPRRCSATPWIEPPRRAPKAARSRPSTSPKPPEALASALTAATTSTTSPSSSTARPSCPAIVASTEGGMEIEHVAHHTPEKHLQGGGSSPPWACRPSRPARSPSSLGFSGDALQASASPS